MVPNGWTKVKLIETASKEKYSFTGGPFGSDLKSSDYTQDGIRIIQLQNIGDGKFHDSYKIYTSKEKADTLTSCNIFPGDIILSKMGDPVARATIIPNHHERYLMASDGIRLKVNEDQYDTYFVHEVINSPLFRNVAFSKSTGSTRKRIGLTDLRNIPFLCPPLPEQQKIAKILATWDKAISTTEHLIDNSKQQKKALMQQLLTGKKRLLDDSGKRFKGDWEEVKLKECTTCLDNKRIPLNSSQRQEMQGEIPYWGANGIVDYVNEHIFDETIVLLAEDGGYFDEFTHRPISNISYGKSWVNNHAHILKAKKNSLNEWVYYSLVHKNILAFINGGTRAKLNKSDMLLIPINLPPIAEQRKIVSVLSNADQEISLLEKQLTHLKQEKKALMQQLLTGKRRVTIDDKESV